MQLFARGFPNFSNQNFDFSFLPEQRFVWRDLRIVVSIHIACIGYHSVRRFECIRAYFESTIGPSHLQWMAWKWLSTKRMWQQHFRYLRCLCNNIRSGYFGIRCFHDHSSICGWTWQGPYISCRILHNPPGT